MKLFSLSLILQANKQLIVPGKWTHALAYWTFFVSYESKSFLTLTSGGQISKLFSMSLIILSNKLLLFPGKVEKSFKEQMFCFIGPFWKLRIQKFSSIDIRWSMLWNFFLCHWFFKQLCYFMSLTKDQMLWFIGPYRKFWIKKFSNIDTRWWMF